MLQPPPFNTHAGRGLPVRAVIWHRPSCRNSRLRAAPESADAVSITVAQEQCRRQLKAKLRQLVTRCAGRRWVSDHRACMQHCVVMQTHCCCADRAPGGRHNQAQAPDAVSRASLVEVVDQLSALNPNPDSALSPLINGRYTSSFAVAALAVNWGCHRGIQESCAKGTALHVHNSCNVSG